MKLIVKSHTIELEKEEIINEGEFNVQKCIFEFSQEYNLLTKYAVFSNCNGSYKILIVDNQCDMPIEILKDKETFTLGVYGYYAEDDELKIRYSPIPILISMEKGSYVEDAETTVKPTPTELEQLQTQVTNNKNDIDALKEKCINYDEEVEEIKDDIIEINNNINGINQDISRLDQEQEEQNTNIQSNTDAISEINSSINDINGEIDAINNNIGVINGNIQTIEGNITSIETTITGQQQEINTLNTSLEEEITNRENGDINLQSQIDAIVSSSDLKDIVGTYAELQEYDKSTLGNNDIIKVLNDETRENAQTYYRYNAITQSFVYIGEEAPYYTKSEIDTTLLPYVKNTDYATSTKGGVFKISSAYATRIENGYLEASEKTYNDYQNLDNNSFVGKGTLENVITGKDLTTKQYVDDNVESINQAFIDMEEVFTQSQEIQDTKINFLNTEIDNLVAILDKETATGTNTLSYDKAKAYNVLDSKIRGNVEQKTLSGKNIWELPNNDVQNGITFTKNSDGTFNLSGTATKDAYFKTWIPIDEFENNAQYTLSSNMNVEGFEFRFEEYTAIDGAWVKQYSKIGNNQPPRTPTATLVKGTGTYVRLSIFCYNGKTLNVNNVKVQLEKNSTETEWEQYCGGTASPNPDYPQEVKALKSYQLFDGEMEQGSLNSQGYLSSSTRIRTKNFIDVLPNEEYTFNANSKKPIQCYLFEYDENETFVKQYSTTWANIPFNFTTDDNVKKIKIVVRYSDNSDIIPNDINDIVILRGGKLKKYTQKGKIAKRHRGYNFYNRNIMQYSNSSTSDFNITSQTNMTRVRTNSVLIDTDYRTFTMFGFTNNVYLIAVRQFDEKRNYIGQVTATNNSFTLSDDCKYIHYIFRNVANTELEIAIVENMDLYLVEGTEQKPYEPYKEEIQYIDLDNNEVLTDDEIQIDRLGNAKLIKKWKKIVLDGSESWRTVTSARPSFAMTTFTDKVSGVDNFYCDKFTYKGNAQTTDLGYAMSFNSGQYSNYMYIQLPPEICEIGNVEQFKQWLSNNHTTVYYPLIEPEIIDLPKCEPLKSLEGVNNVDVLATLEPTYLEETYAYDLRKELEITEWQFYKAFMGTANNNLPSNWNELLITSNVGGEKSSIDIYKEQLVNGDNDVISPGYYLSASSNLAVVFNINTTNNTINLKTANYNGSNVATMSQYRIYYR